ncbi:maternal embryonic leucine zipper kinase-like [Onthophagus taurus]|uniref:maternal embryonic leucine zipper kinase-like n=1 Tax=Onthophagus taurus TaxID=166361 RepID=UPI000C205BF1|nr:maternal embryonic leucine zipper kinase-like [Onthophagus taurus]
MVRYAALKGFYEVEKTIGCGGFAKVKMGTHIATGEKVAIKIMEKAALNDELPRVKLELQALKTLSHQHICKLYQVIETSMHYFIIMEYCSGGELFDHIVENSKLSETQSRMFFKQIVSAVAYLHSLGYAHRDLKPENVLLDRNQNLKLIDFGLCAKPEGGAQSLLLTSCGSPTYAAPELVLGKQYLGESVDVWAMGVLLYALLAGYLPFDDTNIDSLYKKILSGKYEEPVFMSQESRKFIRQMLQVDPKKRITVKEILTHPWITLGVLDPVDTSPDCIKCYDKECVVALARYHGVNNEDMWRHLKRWRYDYDMATYFLLMDRKKRKLPLKLNIMATKLPIRVKSADTIKVHVNLPELTRKSANLPLCENTVDNNVKVIITSPDVTPLKDNVDIKELKASHQNGFKLNKAKAGEVKFETIMRKPMKRLRSPNLDGDYSPIPTKKILNDVTSSASTPDSKKIKTCSETPSSARKVLGSIERSIHLMKNVLTPKKTLESSQNLQPIVLTNKDLFNVSTTQCNDAEFVINELEKALARKGIDCHRKGFRLRGKMEPNTLTKFGGCSFELEICYLPNMVTASKVSSVKTPIKSTSSEMERMNVPSVPATIGIRRKRLKGDAWCYKKVCEQVLALTATELRQPKESSV